MCFQYLFLVAIFTTCIVYGTAQTTSIKEQPTVRLMNAVHGEVLMPVVGLGTGGYGTPEGKGGEYWGPEQGHNATVAWLKAGGRRIDTADNYDSRDGIGTGWKASGVPRSEIFITSKVDPAGYNETLDAFAGILQSLQTDYVDLLLIHWPGIPQRMIGNSIGAEIRIQTWQALEKIFQQNQVRFILALLTYRWFCQSQVSISYSSYILNENEIDTFSRFVPSVSAISK